MEKLKQYSLKGLDFVVHSTEKAKGVLSKPKEMSEQVTQSLVNVLTTYVAPHTSSDMDVLLVGVADRTEEILALLLSLNPRRITVLEPGNLFKRAKRKWDSFQTKQPYEQRKRFRKVVEFKKEKMETDQGSHGIVLAFSIHPLLQNEEHLRTLASKTSHLLVVTANNLNSVRWGSMSEAEYIDRNLSRNNDLEMVVRMQKLNIDTMDGELWVLKNKG